MVDTPDPPFTTWRRLALIFGVWALVAVMSTQTLGFALTRTGRSFDWVPIFASNLASCMLWATFTPFLLALGRRFRIERGVWPMHLALHLAVGVAFTMLDVYVWKLEAPYIRPGMPAFVLPFLVEVARQLAARPGLVLHHRRARARRVLRGGVARRVAYGARSSSRSSMRPGSMPCSRSSDRTSCSTR